jgi:hypothetical protein
MATSSISTGTSPLTILYQIAQNQASLTQTIQISQISQDLQNQLNRQIASLQSPVDQVSIDISQNRINSLQAQQKTVSALETLFGNNGNLLADMTNQLTLMTAAVSKSDGTGFDDALSALNTDLTDLTPPAWNALFQSDGIAQLKTNGIAIQSSATYDLSTPAGQAAATADITTAQNLLQGILKINTGNQTVAGSQLAALDGQINALQTQQQQQQSEASQANAQQIAQLQQNMANQLHLIELNLGNSGQVASMLNQVINPPQQVTSVFGALVNAVGETGSTAETRLGQTPAVLSLFA